MEIDPPESSGARLGLAAGIVAAGAAVGGAAGAFLPVLPNVASRSKSVLGAAFGAAVTAVGAFGLSEFLGGDWAEVEKDTAILGASLVGAMGLMSMIGTAAAAAPSGAPQLPAASPSNYSASLQNSGGTLNMAVGDTLSVNLPGGPSAFSWAASSGGVVRWLTSSEAADGTSTSYVFGAAVSGTAQIVATSSSGGQNFTASINVS